MVWIILDENNVVKMAHFGELNDDEQAYGYIEAPDGVECGMVRQADGSFANPHDDTQPDIAADAPITEGATE